MKKRTRLIAVFSLSEPFLNLPANLGGLHQPHPHKKARGSPGFYILLACAQDVRYLSVKNM